MSAPFSKANPGPNPQGKYSAYSAPGQAGAAPPRSHGGNRDPNAQSRQQAAAEPQRTFSAGSSTTYANSAGDPKLSPQGSPQYARAYAQGQGQQSQYQDISRDFPNTGPASSTHGANGNVNEKGAEATVQHGSAAISHDDIEALQHFNAPSQKGYGNFSHVQTTWRFKFPNLFQHQGIQAESEPHHHRDVLQRATQFGREDYYLSPTDGHLAKLVVQSTQDIYDAYQHVTWRRTFIRNRSAWLLQAASMPYREGRDEDLGFKAAMWLPSCIAVLTLMIAPIDVSGQVRNGGNYDAFPYRDWGYAYHTRNPHEAKANSLKLTDADKGYSSLSTHDEPAPSDSARFVEPKYLCFLEYNGSPRELSWWKQQHGDQSATPAYVFVSFTSTQLNPDIDSDLRFLHHVGSEAAKAAGVLAYWLSDACLGNTNSEVEESVFGMSDIIRGAHSIVIAVGNTGGENLNGWDLLGRWGYRVWTFPEVLLCPTENIDIYAKQYDRQGYDGRELERGQSPPRYSRFTLHKRNFASVWHDAPQSRELIDHFEGTLILSPVELQTIALRCFHNRQTNQYLPGDIAYALMGLLLRRPKVVAADTAFQAFARLSLANDSDQLMERLTCILPQSPTQPWHDMADQWSIALSDIYPSIQVCGIGSTPNTVIIDGAHAAAIRWKAFAPVASLTRESWKRFLARYFMRSTSYVFLIGITFVSVGAAGSGAAFTAIGAIFLVVSLITILLSPWLIRLLYTGKLWGTQPWFFGFEGYMPLHDIERHIFGRNDKHLKWSVAGSPLSAHAENKFGECVGVDPTCKPDVAKRVAKAVKAGMGEERIFTLVDTYTLTVTMFVARRPPVAVVLCGYEGGMQRAMLCSYEYSTQTLFRESVVRMETPVLEKMSRVGRFKFGFNRPWEG